MGLVVEVQRPCLVHLLQLLPVPKVEGEVGGDDGFADDLQHLLVLAGAQRGEDIVPFQLQRDQRKTTNSTHTQLSRHLQLSETVWTTMPNATVVTSSGKHGDCFVVMMELRWGRRSRQA